MGSSGKKKTTFAKLAREAKLRERRSDKEARKQARRLEATTPSLSAVADPDLELDPEAEAEGEGEKPPDPDER